LRIKDDIKNNRFVTKKEKLLAQRKLDRYLKIYAGLVGLEKLPEAIFVVDVKKEAIAINEAIRTGIKIVAITDTNVDPTPVDFSIPANDDAVGSVQIIVEYLVDAWIEGLGEKGKDREAEAVKKAKEEAKLAKEQEEAKVE
jgi:small subunit ribosomal protein S2